MLSYNLTFIFVYIGSSVVWPNEMKMSFWSTMNDNYSSLKKGEYCIILVQDDCKEVKCITLTREEINPPNGNAQPFCKIVQDHPPKNIESFFKNFLDIVINLDGVSCNFQIIREHNSKEFLERKSEMKDNIIAVMSEEYDKRLHDAVILARSDEKPPWVLLHSDKFVS